MKKIVFFNGFWKLAALIAAVAVFTGCEQSLGGSSGLPVLEGTVTISGSYQVGGILTAELTGFNVPDGTPEALYRYVWQRGNVADDTFTADAENEAGEDNNAADYLIAEADLNKHIRVVVSVTGYRGSVSSDPVGPVTAAGVPTYSVTIGTLTHGSVTASKTSAAAGDTITLAVNAEGGYKLTDDSLQVTKSGGENITVTPVTDTTYTFTMPAADVNVTAEFKELPEGTYSISAGTMTGGTVGRSPASAAENATVTLTVTPYEGFQYTDDSLSVTYGENQTITPTAGANNTFTFTMPAANVTVTATFTAISYTISIDGSITNGTVTANPTSATMGTQITLTVSPAANYKLKSGSLKVNNGSVTVSGNGPYTFTMPAANVTVTAQFDEEYNENDGITATKIPTTWISSTIQEMMTYPKMNSVAYKKDVGFVIGSGNDYQKPAFAISTSGASPWSVQEISNVPTFNSFVGKIRRLNNIFIATRGSGPTVAIISDDGLNWEETTISFGTKGFAYGEGVYLAAGQMGQAAYSTDDMQTWTKLENTNTGFTGSGNTRYINAAAYGDGKFVIGGGQGRAAVSTDKCLTWTMCQLTGTTSPYSIFDGPSGFIDSIIYFKGKFVALGAVDGADAKSATSTDGLNWTQGSATGLKTSSDTSPLMAHGAGYIVAVDVQGNAAYSSDGISWTSCGNTGFDISTPAKDVAYGNGRFVIVGNNGKVAYCDVK
jgi:hypothetical protein